MFQKLSILGRSSTFFFQTIGPLGPHGICGKVECMNQADLRDLIDNEVKRVKIQNHSNYGAWHTALKPYARQIIDFILEEDLTPEYIMFAQDAPEDEQEEYRFLIIIAGGNPDPAVMPALTNFVLADILLEIREFGNKPS
jgi:hypothetical protein